jgi:hypothetical protein
MMAIVGIWEFIYDLGWGGLLGLVALVCVCLPCRWDPAIRLKEWFEGWDREGPDDHDSGLCPHGLVWDECSECCH